LDQPEFVHHLSVERYTVSPRKSPKKPACFSKHHDIDAARPSKQLSIIPAGLPPTMQQRPSNPLHGAGTATMTSVLFHRVFFALRFYRPNRVTLSHRDLTR
jgi:hypothetical protein